MCSVRMRASFGVRIKFVLESNEKKTTQLLYKYFTVIENEQEVQMI